MLLAKPKILTVWPFALKAGWPLSISSFVELRKDGKLILERIDVREHSKGSDKSCSKKTTFVEPVIFQTWLPELLTPQNTHKQLLGLCAQRESKLSMTLQSFQNLASTCLCRLSSHHDPQGTPVSCQSQLPPVFPFSETFLMLLPTPFTFLLMQYHSLVLTNVISSENSLLFPLRCLCWVGT